MATRLAWWTIPATVVVLVRVVTLEPKGSVSTSPPARSSEIEGSGVSESVMLQDASGVRAGPLGLSFDDALVLQLPTEVGRQRVDFTLLRYLPGQSEPSLWLHGNPRTGPDQTLPILGLPQGRYAVELTWTADGKEHTEGRDDVCVPGRVDFTR